jgi:glucan phosphorylase
LTSFTGKFLLHNYKQALSILETRPTINAALSKVGAADGAVVEGWLHEEESYLRGLSKEPLEETLEMEYYKMVMNLRESE